MGSCVFCDGRATGPRRIEVPCSQDGDESYCEACQDLVDLEDMIEEATENLLAMRERRYKLLSEVNRAHDKIMDHFPPEIFTEILAQALPTVDEYHWGNLNARQVLAQVSTRWRDTAISTPTLWSTIPIFVRQDQSPRAMHRALPSLLSFSGNLPLSIIFNAESSIEMEEYTDKYFKLMDGIIKMVNAQSGRLVVLRARGASDWLRYIDLQSNGAPNLRQLEISTKYEDPDESYIVTDENGYARCIGRDQDFDGSQEIRIGPSVQPSSLSLEQWTLGHLLVGTTRLVRIEITHVSVRNCLAIVEDCPALAVLSAYDLHEDETPLDARVVLHRNLRELAVRRSGDVLKQLLSALELPQLLRLSMDDIQDQHAFAAVLSLFRRSPPALESLELGISHGFYWRRELSDPEPASSYIRSVIPCIFDMTSPSVQSVLLATYDYPFTHFVEPQELIDILFPLGRQWPLLQTMTIFSISSVWSRTLFLLVQRLSEQPLCSSQPQICIQVWFDYSETFSLDALLASSIFNQAAVFPKGSRLEAIAPEIISEMLSLIDIHRLRIALSMHQRYREAEATDVFPDIVSRLRTICTHSSLDI